MFLMHVDLRADESTRSGSCASELDDVVQRLRSRLTNDRSAQELVVAVLDDLRGAGYDALDAVEPSQYEARGRFCDRSTQQWPIF